MVEVCLENKRNRPKKCHAPFSHDQHVNKNMLCHVRLILMCGHVHPPTYVQSQRPVSLPLCKVSMSNSITIRKGILQGSKVGSGQVKYIEKSKVGGDCADSLKLRPKS